MEYSEARVRLNKALRKMTYRVRKLEDDLLSRKFTDLKKSICRSLRRMDNLVREMVADENSCGRK